GKYSHAFELSRLTHDRSPLRNSFAMTEEVRPPASVKGEKNLFMAVSISSVERSEISAWSTFVSGYADVMIDAGLVGDSISRSFASKKGLKFPSEFSS